MAILTSNVQAGPLDGSVVAGAGTISVSGDTTTILQSTPRLSLEWQSFNIAPQETVNFLQPSATAIAVNRILDTNGSRILGRLNANGQVYLLNPNGILFGSGAQVNVAALVATTLEHAVTSSDGSSIAFSGDGQGDIVNLGTINAARGGYVALLGNRVRNAGTITAESGTIAMGAGSAATLTFSGSSLVRMQVEQSVLDSAAQNGGLLQADGGMVLMSAGARDSLLASVVNNTGVITARTAEERDGVIILLGGMSAGTTSVGGILDASALQGGNGGFIETSAARVLVASDATVTTAAPAGTAGTWLIDPMDFTIAASGGDTTGAALTNSLAFGNVVVQSIAGATGTEGNVNVNDSISWGANELRLEADNNININARLDVTGSGSLRLDYGLGAVASGNSSSINVNAPVYLPAGNHYRTLLGSDGILQEYTVLTGIGSTGSLSATDLQGINGNLDGYYALGNDIDASVTAAWDGGDGFLPIGISLAPFTGVLDGLGHAISHLTISRPNTDMVGLFSNTSPSAMIRNLGLINSSVIGANFTGALVGQHQGMISRSYSTATVTGLGNLVGGLVGDMNQGSILNSYATGNVSGDFAIGGLAGASFSGTIRNSYATGAVTGIAFIGGLVGQHLNSSTAYAYATGSVTASSDYIGGLTGFTDGGDVSYAYATGTVTGGAYVGALVGRRDNTAFSSSYSNTGGAAAASGDGNNLGIADLTGADLRTAASFSSFTFTSTPGAPDSWVIVDVDGTLNNAAGAAGATMPMLASEYSASIRNAHQLQLMAMATAADYTLETNIAAAATGTGTDAWGTSGFAPIGNLGTPYTGVFDGLDHRITGLTINLTTPNVGLFGHTSTGTIRNVGLDGGSVTGGAGTGALVGNNTTATISNSHASMNVSGGAGTGGLVGSNTFGAISDSYATGSVNGAAGSGGLVGSNTAGAISGSFASGDVVGAAGTGGLVGSNTSGPITDSYAIGGVDGAAGTGGLVGTSTSGLITNTYARGAVTSSGAGFGGLIGAGTPGAVTSSYWDAVSSGQLLSPGGGEARSSARMMEQSNFVDWDFADVWLMFEGTTSPLLLALMTPVTATANNYSKTYDGSAYAGGNGLTYSTALEDGAPAGALDFDAGSSSGAINAGSYVITPGGLQTDQRYLITYGNGVLTVSQAALTATVTASKAYDGDVVAAPVLTITSGLVGTQTIAATGTGTFNTKDVVTANLVTVDSTALADGTNGGLASNYSLASGQTGAATITPATLTATAAAAGKAYDGDAAAAPVLTITAGLAGTETVVATGSGTFNTKDVLTANLVTVNTTALADGTNGGLASNYSLGSGQTAAASITARALTAAAAASGKIYDGNNAAASTLTISTGLVGTESVGATGSGTFNTKDVLTANLVTINSTALQDGDNGGLASNYSLAAGQTAAAMITAANLAISGVTAVDKVYDASNAAALRGTPTVAALAGDSVAVAGNGRGEFIDAAVGSNKPVTVTGFVLNGTDAPNYVAQQPQGLTASITAAGTPPPGPTTPPVIDVPVTPVAPVVPVVPVQPGNPEAPQLNATWQPANALFAQQLRASPVVSPSPVLTVTKGCAVRSMPSQTAGGTLRVLGDGVRLDEKTAQDACTPGGAAAAGEIL